LNITITTSHQIANFRQSWDDLLPATHHLRSRHLKAFENAAIENISNNYVQVFLQNELIGLLYLQQFCFEHKHLNFNSKPTVSSRLIQCILPKQIPVLVCGHLFRINFEGYYFKDAAHLPHLFEAIELFCKQTNSRHRGIIVKDCTGEFRQKDCRLFDYRYFNGDVTMEISKKLEWLNFDSYIQSLKKDYRQRAKKILKHFDGIETKELDADEILNQSAAIEKLYWNVVNKQTVKLGTINTAYFYELKKDLQQNFELHGMYMNGVMIGFHTFIFYEQTMETHFIGLDYEVNKTHNLYFNILFISIRKMIDGKFDLLELGRTGREAKANAGAVSRQVFNYIKVNNWLVKLTINFFLKRFNKIANYNLAERSVFK
jgi:hypothetical protein